MNVGSKEMLIDRVQQLELRLCQAMGTIGPDPWLLEVDMTMAQLRTFFLLAPTAAEGAEGLRVSDLARRLGVSAPTASTLVDRLVDRGVVDRREDPHDRRQQRCRLTPQGRELLARSFEGSRVRTRLLLSELSVDELQTVLGGIKILVTAAERLTSAPQPVGTG